MMQKKIWKTSYHDNRIIDANTATLNNGVLRSNTVIILDINPDGNGMAEHLRDYISIIIEQYRDYCLDKMPCI